MSTVTIESVTKVYRKGTAEIRPLDGIDLVVEPGEFVCLMGPSGSGKTTLLNLVAGIDRPTTGRVFVGDDEVSAMSESALAPWRTRSIGYIFQLYNLIPVLTAWENVELPLLLLPLSKKKRRQHVSTALEAVGLPDRKDHYPRQLSGGEEQRVAIARAVVVDPRILVADEPTGDLDAQSGQEVLELLAALRRDFGKTLLMVTHDPRAASFASRIVHLEKGVLVEPEKAVIREEEAS
ncbi:MAG: ABC transporter ATP-binding protein [Planctomycetota bacterium]|jgi:putative ABC transport system ATP-binding protein